MSDVSSPRKMIAESLVEIIKKHGTREFSEVRASLTKADLGRTEEAFIVRLAEALANCFLDGLLELSVEEVTKTKEYDGALSRGERELVLTLSKKLPSLKAHVDFVFRYGSLELSSLNYEFRLDSEIAAPNIRVIIEGNSISYISFGPVDVTLTLSLSRGGFDLKLGTFERQLNLEYRWDTERKPDVDLMTRAKPPSAIGFGSLETVFCSTCGAEIRQDAKFCYKCGAKRTQTAS